MDSTSPDIHANSQVNSTSKHNSITLSRNKYFSLIIMIPGRLSIDISWLAPSLPFPSSPSLLSPPLRALDSLPTRLTRQTPRSQPVITLQVDTHTTRAFFFSFPRGWGRSGLLCFSVYKRDETRTHTLLMQLLPRR